MTNLKCFHCELPASSSFKTEIDSQERFFCCAGCQAVASLIDSGGFSEFYQFRDKSNYKVNEALPEYSQYDLPSLRSAVVKSVDENVSRVSFYLPTISCAACVWLIEKYFHTLTGVAKVSVNGTSQICVIDFFSKQLVVSSIMSALAKIGYPPELMQSNRAQELFHEEQKKHLLRLGVAGLSMMQIGMVSAALYSGAIQGIDDQWQWLLRWVSLIFAVPVMFYSARPFFRNAYHSLKLGGLNMDVPVSLALIVAFIASVYATVFNTGDVYFDSVSMFTFFLLLGRYIERRIRFKNQNESLRLFNLLPIAAYRLDGDEKVMTALNEIKPLDLLWVDAGDVFPCDGIVTQGESYADEALLTGESNPQKKTVGDHIIAGSINGDSALTIKVQAIGSNTRLAAIESIVEQAEQSKPVQVLLADKLSGYFVMAVLIVSVVVGLTWWFVDPSRALWVVLSLLVVTCPCALSLATPAAIGAATSQLRKAGFLIRNGSVLETLNTINNVIFDKTGTLTHGKFELTKVNIINTHYDEHSIINMIAALEKFSRHPIASAFENVHTTIRSTDVQVVPGLGVKGYIDQTFVCFGSIKLAQSLFPETKFCENTHTDESLIWLCLASSKGVIAWVGLSDTIRENAGCVIKKMISTGKNVTLLSGDNKQNVDRLVNTLGGMSFQSDCSWEDKLAFLADLQKQKKCVLMVGDGINDAPVLSAADVSVAMQSGSQLAKSKADAVLINGDLNAISIAFETAKDTKKIIKQNLMWAISYNLLALPLASLGLIPPYLAAAGMSASSLVVVMNSLRLNR